MRDIPRFALLCCGKPAFEMGRRVILSKSQLGDVRPFNHIILVDDGSGDCPRVDLVRLKRPGC